MMRRMRMTGAIAALLASTLAPGVSHAQEGEIRKEISLVQKRAASGPNSAVPMPLDARLVTYNFDRDYDYPVLTRPFTMVHLEFPKGEALKGYYVSDSSASRWTFKPAKTGRDLFVMSKGDNLLNTATIITNLRTYQVTFVSSAKGAYYKRVNWESINDMVGMSEGFDTFGGGFTPTKNAGDQAAQSEWQRYSTPQHRQTDESKAARGARSTEQVDISKANFDYRIEGDAPFKPSMVFDDGTFTWIQLPAGVQEVPAIFALGADGVAELVNFTVRRNYFVVQRLLPDGALLKLRQQEVRIFNKRGKACGLFGCGVGTVKNINGDYP